MYEQLHSKIHKSVWKKKLHIIAKKKHMITKPESAYTDNFNKRVFPLKQFSYFEIMIKVCLRCSSQFD